ncbi:MULTISPECIES: hypothetical protein [Mobiluncus]|uniref:Uncharacterized protein n=1 Tax=Mobiluncus curtisii TaxID=2051 RepID=A0A7Y0YCU8_9ACTO|nr:MULTISPECIES: hypothetical protein [Mobiluncus]MCU9988022.1 hypothetical protein [Mobiluncus curtisii]MCV0001240.1 hypothetical protein [Mobiluncus curtisii]NMW43733.1 hypothetical protein [Mobiluncus curtisii]NMW50059.1 hypothetical protein [Mobiluncus curtisii]NMW84068.1 hypothetical protein [Mobiluncus curtisii]
MKKRIPEILSGTVAAFLLAFSAGIPSAVAVGPGSWMDQVTGAPSLYRTQQWYDSAKLKPWTNDLVGKITNIKVRATITNPPTVGQGLAAGLCPVGYSEYYCADITQFVYGASVNGTITDFAGYPPATSFYFKWGVMDSKNQPIFPVTVISKQSIEVSYE